MVIPEQHIENLQHVLFGNQKQSSEFNRAIVISIIEAIAPKGFSDFSTLHAVNETLQHYIVHTLRHPEEMDYVLRFIIGIDSYDLLLQKGSAECTLRAVKPMPDSPKIVYRFLLKSDLAHEVTSGKLSGVTMDHEPDNSYLGELVHIDKDKEETLGEKAKRLHDEWVDCAPGSWITDPTLDGNTWAIAVLVADAKLNNKA